LYELRNNIIMNLENILNEVTKIAKTSGNLIRERFDLKEKFVFEEKGINDYVTEFDKQSEKLIIEELSTLLPEAGFIAEENTKNTRSEIYNWIVDPLDGTTNFMHGIFPVAISIALMKENEIVLGVVYEVGLDECFTAIKDKGAFLNGKRIQVSDNDSLKKSLIATGFPFRNFTLLEPYLNILGELTGKTRGIRRLGSAATDLAYVACGRFDAFYEYDLKPWDVAAGTLIISEAGGKNTDFNGQNNFIFGQQIISSNNKIHNLLINIVKKHLKKTRF